MSEPRTAAGRRLLDIVKIDGWTAEGENGPAAYILAIEAEAARPAVASEGLRAALEALVAETDASGDSDSEAYEQARAALASDAGSVGALDVDTLTAILHRFHHLTPCPYPMHTGYHPSIAGKKPCEMDAAAYDAEGEQK